MMTTKGKHDLVYVVQRELNTSVGTVEVARTKSLDRAEEIAEAARREHPANRVEIIELTARR